MAGAATGAQIEQIFYQAGRRQLDQLYLGALPSFAGMEPGAAGTEGEDAAETACAEVVDQLERVGTVAFERQNSLPGTHTLTWYCCLSAR